MTITAETTTKGTGQRIRDRRIVLGIKQTALAKSSEISASYLNLIEHDRRKVGDKLLRRIAGVLDVPAHALRVGHDTGLADALRAIARGEDAGPEIAAVGAFVAQFPGWARLLVAQSQRVTGLQQVVAGLDGQLSHDPVLSENMHDLLAAVSAIRSTSSILMANPEIAPDWRDRFHGNIDSESRRLAETSHAIAAHLDGLAHKDRTGLTPLDAALRFLDDARYQFAQIERLGAACIADLLATENSDTRAVLSNHLHGYAAETAAMPLDRFGRDAQRARFDPAVLAKWYDVDIVAVFRRLASLPRTPERPDIGLLACDQAGALLFCKSPDGLAVRDAGALCPHLPLFDVLRQPDRPIRRAVQLDNGTQFDAIVVAEMTAAASFDNDPTYTAWMLLVERTADGPARAVGSHCRMCRHADCAARRQPSVLT